MRDLILGVPVLLAFFAGTEIDDAPLAAILVFFAACLAGPVLRGLIERGWRP